MKKNSRKKIEISNDVWNRLHDLKKELSYKKWSAVIKWLLDQSDSKGETVLDSQKPDHEKLLQDIIGSDSWSHVQELMFSHHLDISGALRHLLDCHRLLEQEDTHQRLASRDSIEEIHSHIDKIRPLQEPAAKVTSETSVDMSPVPNESPDHVSDTGKSEWLSCPICYHSMPLLVEVDKNGNPLNKPEAGVKFKSVGGILQRRFTGPGDDYLPLEARFGGKVIVEESMAISTLKRLDKNLFDDFSNTLKNAVHRFTGTVWWE